MQSLSQKNIEDKILEHYIEYQYSFIEFQSNFLSGLYNRYQSVENGNIVLYYAQQAHQTILRKKDYDLNFNLSFEKFWDNHNEITPTKISIIQIGKETSLPKETTRRKILELTKQQVLNKKNKNIGWLPTEQYKKNYNLIVEQEINNVCKLIKFICEKMNFSISREVLVKEIKKEFSFYWFHYLGAQLKYLKIWNTQLNDIELALIFMQLAHVFTTKTKEKNISHVYIHKDPSRFKEFISSSVSATSIAEVTKIPRATCVRKLETLVKLKLISQDQMSKRFYINPSSLAEDLIPRKLTQKVVVIFSDFFFICLRALSVKTLN